jgi:hypothetical protein
VQVQENTLTHDDWIESAGKSRGRIGVSTWNGIILYIAYSTFERYSQGRMLLSVRGRSEQRAVLIPLIDHPVESSKEKERGKPL